MKKTEAELLNDNKILQYHHLVDKKNRKNSFLAHIEY